MFSASPDLSAVLETPALIAAVIANFAGGIAK